MKFLYSFFIISIFTLTGCSTTTSNSKTGLNKEYVIVLEQDLQIETKGQFGNGNINAGELSLQKGTYAPVPKTLFGPQRYENSSLSAQFTQKKTFRKETTSSVFPSFSINKNNELVVYLPLKNKGQYLYVGKVTDSSKFKLAEVTQQ